MEDEKHGTTTQVTFRLEKSVLAKMKRTARDISAATDLKLTYTDLFRYYATKCGNRFFLDVLRDLKDNAVHEDTGVEKDIDNLHARHHHENVGKN